MSTGDLELGRTESQHGLKGLPDKEQRSLESMGPIDTLDSKTIMEGKYDA